MRDFRLEARNFELITADFTAIQETAASILRALSGGAFIAGGPLEQWTKQGALLLEPPKCDDTIRNWRDPFVLPPSAAPEGLFHMVVGAATDAGGGILLYKSEKLTAGTLVEL